MQKSKGKKLPGYGTAKPALAVFLLLLVVTPLFARDYPPAASAPKPIVIPNPAIQTLPNGLQVVVVERHTLPLITVRIVIRSGAECDPPTLPGTAMLVNGLLSEGTESRTSRQIADAVDSVGGVVENDVDWDSSYLGLSVLTDRASLAFDLVSDMMIHPGFHPEEIERQRKQVLSSLQVSLGDPAYVADTAFQDLIFAGTPYGHSEDGTQDSAQRITAADLRAYHRLYYQPANSILAVVGDISAPEALALANRYFAPWQNTSTVPKPAAAAARLPTGRKVLAVAKHDAVQTEIRIGSLGVSRDHPDFLPLTIVNEILGGPSENRLFKALRTRSGLTYGASSDLITRHQMGAWVAKTFTRTPETVKSAHIAMEQVQSIQQHGISRAELETAQSYLVGHLALEFETSESVAGKVLDLIEQGLPLDYWTTYPQKIQNVTIDQVDAAARRYLDTDHDVVVFVGDVADFKKDFKKFGEVHAIPLKEIDFGSPDFMKMTAR